MPERGDAGRVLGAWHRRRTHLDAVSLLVTYLLLLFCLESRWVVGPLGGAGNPAVMVSCAGFLWWVFYHAQRPRATGAGPSPVRAALLVVLGAFAASFASAMSRPINGTESSTAHLGLITVVGWMGVALLAHDGVPTHARLQRLVTWLVALAGALAALGLVQFIAGDSLVRSISWPGLSTTVPLGDLQSRNGFTRPSGTALHPIEFGAVLTTVLPLALVWARRTSTAPLLLRWLPAGLMGLGVVVSISRSAVLCGVLGIVVLAAGWPPRARRALLACTVLLVAVVAVTIPGMLGSLRGLFLAGDSDNSVASRTGSYPIAGEFFERAPLFGRGYSTFLPVYRIFDNQYLLLLIEVGAVGLLSFLALLVTAGVCARRTRRRSTDPAVRELAQALLAGTCAGGLGLALFDGLSFPMSTGVLFLVLGLTGALHRLSRDGEVGDDGVHRLAASRQAAVAREPVSG